MMRLSMLVVCVGISASLSATLASAQPDVVVWKDKARVALLLGSESGLNEALHLYERACAEGDSESCFRAGALRERQPDGGADAAALYERGCKLGLAESCTALGVMYSVGDRVEPDVPRSTRLYRLGCDRGHGVGCRLAAVRCLSGRDGSPDRIGALEFFARGCSAGDGESCRAHAALANEAP